MKFWGSRTYKAKSARAMDARVRKGICSVISATRSRQLSIKSFPRIVTKSLAASAAMVVVDRINRTTTTNTAYNNLLPPIVMPPTLLGLGLLHLHQTQTINPDFALSVHLYGKPNLFGPLRRIHSGFNQLPITGPCHVSEKARAYISFPAHFCNQDEMNSLPAPQSFGLHPGGGFKGYRRKALDIPVRCCYSTTCRKSRRER